MTVNLKPALLGSQFVWTISQLQSAVPKLPDHKSISRAFKYVGSYLCIWAHDSTEPHYLLPHLQHG
jgi:hypothetical protein